MAASLPPQLRFQPLLFGFPLPAAKVYFYAAGTSTPQAVYAADGVTPLSNPLSLDSNGCADFRLGSGLSYKINLTTFNDIQLPGWPIDNIDAIDKSFLLGISSLRSDFANTSDNAKGDALIGVKRKYTGSIGRTLDAEIDDFWVNVKSLGAVGDGVTDDTVAIQNALNTGRSVYLPNGNYKTTTFLTMSTTGQQICGESPHNCYLSNSAATDTLRLAGSLCRVNGIHFRPGSMSADNSYASIRVYSSQCTIDNCRFLSSSDGNGTAILCDDINPAGGGIISGAYAHLIQGNHIGSSGYCHKYAIFFKNLNNGHQATVVSNNCILSLSPITVQYGGANVYRDNLIQSPTPGAGIGIDIGAQVSVELITGNYIEGFLYGVLLRQTVDTYLQAKVIHNHWDNNTNQVYAISASNFLSDSDDGGGYSNIIRGFKRIYSTANEYEMQVADGSTAFKLFSDKTLLTALRAEINTALQWSANDTTQTPTHSLHTAKGNGAAYTGCFLGAGLRDGQRLTLFGLSYSVQILRGTTVRFAADEASVTFGSASGDILVMELIWSQGYGKWYEISRQTV